MEQQRQAHEEAERLEQDIVERLLARESSHRDSLRQDLAVNAILEQISRNYGQLVKLYQDEALRQHEISQITVAPSSSNEEVSFGNFYNSLRLLKDAHRRNDRPMDDAEFHALVKSCEPGEEAFDQLFSGEEMHGRFLDLTFLHEQYNNLPARNEPIDYLSYLSYFDNFDILPKETRSSRAYENYIDELKEYLEGYFRRAKPLFSLVQLQQKVTADFERDCLEIYCEACQRHFANKAVYTGHLNGKKHQKALETPLRKGKETPVALKELLISKYAEVLGKVRQETRENVEHKQSLTPEEREKELSLLDRTEEKPSQDEQEEKEEEEDDGRIYNPKNIPLDWDGKPIPYWLWKLHGLGVRYPCEICGNHTYMGRKAFDQHFFVFSRPLITLMI